MSLKDSITHEVKRAPVAALSGAASALLALLSFAAGWIQNQGATAQLSVSPSPTNVPSSELFTGNVFLVVAYFLATTTAASLLVRAISRNHDITAFFVSVPLLALSNFSVILLMYVAPPRPLSSQLFASAHDLVFYASAAVVIIFCGKTVLQGLASTETAKATESDKESPRSGNDVAGVVVGALIVLAIWSWLVFAGQKRLTSTLLPEITHAADAQLTRNVPASTPDAQAVYDPVR